MEESKVKHNDIIGWFYLHSETRDLIFKPKAAGKPEGGFVNRVWAVRSAKGGGGKMDPFSAWEVILEGLTCGASLPRIQEMAFKWGLTGRHLVKFMANNPAKDEYVTGTHLFLRHVEGVDPDAWFAWLSGQVKRGKIGSKVEIDFSKMPQPPEQ